ncbi:hypothetical protein [Streptomyces sp. NPDC047009]|uniref:hypothetical protein n=1 Tax=Streptomyces sp. NPDC047009 TaxID=3154496 RepID=UPI0033D5F164
MPDAITSVDRIPTSHAVFPPETHPDLQQSAVHHGWNIGRQLVLRAANSPQAAKPRDDENPHREHAVACLRAVGDLDVLAGSLTIALYVAAVLRPAEDFKSSETVVRL